MADKDESKDTIIALEGEHQFFLSPEEKLSPNPLGFISIQINSSECWYIYRDGAYYDKMDAGPHHWWGGFLHKWKAQPINLHTEQMVLSVTGRVKGPRPPQDAPAAAAGIELACNVKTTLELSCSLPNDLESINKFLKYSKPISAFLASLKNIMVEEIGKLPYDQYGEWATTLRDKLQARLEGRDNPHRLIGIEVENLFVTNFAPDSVHDATVLKNFLLVERLRRERMEAQSKTEIDAERARSYVQQGRLTGISPSVLILQELQDSPMGRALIEQDSELRKLQIGISGGVSTNPYGPAANQPPQIGGPQFDNNYLPSPQQNQSGYLGNPSSGSFPPNFAPSSNSQPLSGPFSNGSNTSPFGAGPIPNSRPAMDAGMGSGQPSGPMPFADFGPAEEPVAPERRMQELQALRQAGLEPADKIEPQYDQQGRAIPGSREWVVQVYIPRGNDFLTIIFYCPAGYPTYPPRVQVRMARGGSRWLTPNIVTTWQSQANRSLVEIAREVNNDIPDIL